MENMMNKKVIVRGDRSGVYYGTLTEKNGREVVLKNCRNIWWWEGAASVLQIAVDGVTNPTDSKFTVIVDELELLDAIVIIPCTDKAIECIEGVEEWKIV